MEKKKDEMNNDKNGQKGSEWDKRRSKKKMVNTGRRQREGENKERNATLINRIKG